MGRGALFHLLQNRIYRGEISHRGDVYPGEHEAILDAELWEAVPQRFSNARSDRRSGGFAGHASLLAGMLTDPAGGPMSATHATKAGRRYRYYVSSELITGTREENAEALRVPAAALERAVTDRIVRLLADGPGLLRELRSADALPAEGTQQRRLLTAATSLASRWSMLGHAAQREDLLGLDIQIEVQRNQLMIRIAAAGLEAMLMGKGQAHQGSRNDGSDEGRSIITLTEPVSLRRSGREMALLVGSTVAADRSDPTLVRLIAKAWAMREALVVSEAPTLPLSRRRKVSPNPTRRG